MAKGYANGLRSGKQGSTVFFKITNSSDKIKQGEREYATVVANPQTTSQAAQRLKLTPAVNFYRALKNEVLNHAFQGVKYGGRSYAKFSKIVLAKTFNNVFPFVPRGTTAFIPGEYPLSRGSLPSISIREIENSNLPSVIKLEREIFTDDTLISYEEWIEDILTLNPLWKKGDQLTIVAVRLDQSTGIFTPIVRRIILDSDKYDASFTASQVLQSLGILLSEDYIELGIPGYVNDSSLYRDIVAAAIIVSRPSISQTSGTLSWLRSNTDLYCETSLFPGYFTQEAYDIAIASYQDAAVDVNSAWYLNQGTTRGAGDGEPVPSPFAVTVNNNPDVDPFNLPQITGASAGEAGSLGYCTQLHGTTPLPVLEKITSGGITTIKGQVFNTSTKQWVDGTMVASGANANITGSYLRKAQAQELTNTYGYIIR